VTATIARARRTRGRRGGRERGDQVRLYTSIVKHVAAEMDPCRRIYVPCPAPVFVLRSHLNTCIHLTAYIRIDAYRVHEFFLSLLLIIVYMKLQNADFFPKYYRSLAEAVQMFRDVASTVGKFFIFKFRGSD